MRKKGAPEELVREELLFEMTTHLGFPKELIAVERALKSMPHLIGEKVPNRRFDITCFAKEIHPKHPLYPLLIVECKKEVLTEETVRQILGYNYYVKAYFLAIASRDDLLMIVPGESANSPRFVKGLMRYEEMLELVRKKRDAWSGF